MIGKLSGCVYLLFQEAATQRKAVVESRRDVKVQNFVRGHRVVGFHDQGGRSDRDRPDGQEVADGQHLHAPPSCWGL